MAESIIVHVDPDLADLVPGFLDNRRADVVRMGTALDRSDFDPIRIAGHSMKGSGGGYGFDEITAIGARIERAALARDAAAVRAEIDALAEYLARVEVVYDG
ncbi:MAG: Hpt domain-containing protein [Gammaproteobacteria bacterium]